MIKKILVLFFSLWVLTGCFANNMKNNAVNETWVEEQQLYDALIEAADKNYKNYYFIDLRSQTDYNTAFIEGFVNQSRENLQIFLEDASQWNMIILMSEDTEKTNEAVAYVEGLGFDNVKYVFISLERLFTFFESKNMIMEVTPNGDICPIENPEGC